MGVLVNKPRREPEGGLAQGNDLRRLRPRIRGRQPGRATDAGEAIRLYPQGSS
jgi:hypothetical protein